MGRHRKQRYWNIYRERRALLAEEARQLFPTVNHTLCVGFKSKINDYCVILHLNGVTKWVPRQWWNIEHPDGPNIHQLLRTLDAGVFGNIYLVNKMKDPLPALWICDFCTDTLYISNQFSLVDDHESSKHPEQYVPPNASIGSDDPN